MSIRVSKRDFTTMWSNPQWIIDQTKKITEKLNPYFFFLNKKDLTDRQKEAVKILSTISGAPKTKELVVKFANLIDPSLDIPVVSSEAKMFSIWTYPGGIIAPINTNGGSNYPINKPMLILAPAYGQMAVRYKGMSMDFGNHPPDGSNNYRMCTPDEIKKFLDKYMSSLNYLFEVRD